MSDLDTQIRSYFDANVERVTADDVLAGRRLVEQLHRPTAGWQVSPRFAVGFGFGVTVFVVAGSLGLGLALRQSSDNAASGTVSYAVGAGTSTSTGWSLLGISAVLAVVALILVVLALRSARSRSSTKGEETTMSTTFETPPVDHKLEEAHRTNRWLIAAVVILAIALVVLGAWVVNDVTAESGTEPPAEVQALIVDYGATWNAYDGDSFLGLVSDDYEFYDDHTVARDAEATAALIERGEPYGFTTKTVGGYSAEVSRDGTEYVVSASSMLGTDSAPDSAPGISVYRVQNFPDRGWIVTYHAYVGELPG